MAGVLTLSLCFSACSFLQPTPTPSPAALVKEAKNRIGDTDLKLGPVEYAFDSVGFARLVYKTAGIDLFSTAAARDPSRYGVDIVYQYMALYGELDMGRTPRAGDMVFLGGTRDANHDGHPDAISQVGIVVDVDAEGTATIMTALQTRIGVIHLNRRYPDTAVTPSGKTANTPLVIPTTGKPVFASRLFHSFARIPAPDAQRFAQ